MNRAERRRANRKEKEKESVINIKKNDINQIKESATNEAVSRAFVLMMNVPLIVLRDNFGFGAKRLEKFIDEVKKNMDCLTEGYVSFEDLKNALECDYTGYGKENRKRKGVEIDEMDICKKRITGRG